MALPHLRSAPDLSVGFPSTRITAGEAESLNQQSEQRARSSPMSSEELFAFAKIPLGDFESCLVFIQNHASIDFRASADKMLRQTCKTFERLIKQDFEDRHLQLVQNFANQCVQQFALLDYGADCGFQNLMQYLHGLVLTSDGFRTDYIDRMMKLPLPARIEFMMRPIPGHLDKLRLFCVLFDHLYEKIVRETRYKVEKTILDKVQSRLEDVQARLHLARGRTISSSEIGRAI